MTERPILMSAPMVLATMEDRKTQTRRIVKGTGLEWIGGAGFNPSFVASFENRLSPYGFAGDRLWVKENYRFDVAYDHFKPTLVDPAAAIWYEADKRLIGNGIPGRLRPSIHMPRVFTRAHLHILDVRIERLQACSREDAIAEGLDWVANGDMYGLNGIRESWFQDDPIAAYSALWNHINGPKSWDANPWVWVISFDRIRL